MLQWEHAENERSSSLTFFAIEHEIIDSKLSIYDGLQWDSVMNGISATWYRLKFGGKPLWQQAIPNLLSWRARRVAKRPRIPFKERKNELSREPIYSVALTRKKTLVFVRNLLELITFMKYSRAFLRVSISPPSMLREGNRVLAGSLGKFCCFAFNCKPKENMKTRTLWHRTLCVDGKPF